jgi:hypothetical protein
MCSMLILLLSILFIGACSPASNEVLEYSTSDFYDNPNAKLWKHRVNCVESANENAQLFPGVEMDIYYVDSTNSFVCTHGEPCAGESLEKLVSSINGYENKYYWLDFKNSEYSHVVRDGIPVLKEQLMRLNILDRCIVETKSPECIDSLERFGMFSSYWIPHHYDVNPHYSDEQLQPLIEEVLANHNPTVLSADYTMFAFIKAHFPNEFVHFWTNGLISESDKEIIRTMSEYQNTKVILIDYEKPF